MNAESVGKKDVKHIFVRSREIHDQRYGWFSSGTSHLVGWRKLNVVLQKVNSLQPSISANLFDYGHILFNPGLWARRGRLFDQFLGQGGTT